MSRKAVISDRIYLEDLTPEERDTIYHELHYSIVQQAGIKKIYTIIDNFKRITPKIGSIPSGRTDLIPIDFEIVDKRINKEVTFPTFMGTLRDSQQEIHDSIDDSCMINAPVSWGKTFTALAIVSKLKRKTLIVTHTTMLRDQWITEIKKVLNINAGIIGTGSFDIEPNIVVGNVQTVTKLMNKLSSEFGLIILDELHHVSANTFSTIIDKSKARYKIGLSGTIVRKDGKHILFHDYFGHTVFKPEKENCMTPQVVLVETNILLKPAQHWANRVTDLELYNEDYRHLVVKLASNAASKGYKVLVVASRVEFLKWASEHTPNSACITGDVKSLTDRTAILNSLSTDSVDILYGTLSIFSEGISQSDLSCVILATPINNEPLLTQLIGRIVRKKEGKKQPLILDINLKSTTAATQARARVGHYLREGYTIKTLKI